MRKDFVINALALFVLLAGAFYLVAYLYHSYRVISFPFDLDYGEAIVLRQAISFMGKGWAGLYGNINEYPMAMINYPPVHPLISALLMHFFGSGFYAGRIVSFIATLGIGATIFFIVLRMSGSRLFSSIGALLFIASPYVYSWGTFFRVDSVAIFLSVAGIFWVIKHEKNKQLYLAAIIFAMAFYAKQTALAAFAATLIYLYFQDRAVALKFTAFFGFLALLVLLVMDSATGGFFFTHLVTYNENPFSASNLIYSYYDFLKLHGIMIGLAAGYLLFKFNSLREIKKDILSIYFIISFLVSLTVGNVGSGVNYYIELIAVASILSILLIKKAAPTSNIAAPLLFLILVQMAVFLHLPGRAIGTHGFLGYTPSENAYLAGKSVAAYAKNASGEILVDDGGYALLYGKQVLVQPAAISLMQAKGLWNSKKLMEDISRKRFSLIIIRYWYYPKEIEAAILENYQQKDEVKLIYGDNYQIFSYKIYMPR